MSQVYLPINNKLIWFHLFNFYLLISIFSTETNYSKKTYIKFELSS